MLSRRSLGGITRQNSVSSQGLSLRSGKVLYTVKRYVAIA